MMNGLPLRALVVGMLMTGALGAVGCKEQGPAERAGEAIDETVDKAREGAEEAVEDAGDALDDAQAEARRAAERMKDAADPDPR